MTMKSLSPPLQHKLILLHSGIAAIVKEVTVRFYLSAKDESTGSVSFSAKVIIIFTLIILVGLYVCFLRNFPHLCCGAFFPVFFFFFFLLC